LGVRGAVLQRILLFTQQINAFPKVSMMKEKRFIAVISGLWQGYVEGRALVGSVAVRTKKVGA
jgi:hypothetical protein